MVEKIKITFSEDEDTFDPDICENPTSTDLYHVNYIKLKSYDIEPNLTSWSKLAFVIIYKVHVPNMI